MADRNWIGSSNWAATASWSPAAIPTSADRAIFNGSSRTAFTAIVTGGTVTRPVGSMEMNSFSANGITVAGNTTVSPQPGSITVFGLAGEAINMLSGAGNYTFGVGAGTVKVIFPGSGSYPIKNAGANALTFSSTGIEYTGGATATIAFSITGSGPIDVPGPIARGTGTLGITVNSSGSGYVRLSGVNTHNNGTTVSAGWLQIGNASALGTGTVTMTGGKLSSSAPGAGYTVANALTLNGTMTLGDATNNGEIAVGGEINVNGTSTLTAAAQVHLYGTFKGISDITIAGSGSFFLSATGNTYSGNATINKTGDMYLSFFNSGTPNQLNSASSINIAAGYLYYNGALANTTSVPHYGTAGDSAIGGIIVENTAGVTFSGDLTSSGSGVGFTGRFFTRSAVNESPAVTWSTTASYPTKALVIQAEHPNAAATTHYRTYSGSGNISTTRTYWGHNPNGSAFTAVFRHYGSTGTTFTIGGAGPWVSNDGVNDVTLQYDVNPGNTLNISVPLKEFYAGKILLTKLGTGTLTLSGDNQISKAVSVSAGTLNANSATALGADVSSVSVTSGATLSLGAAPTYTTRSLTISGTGSSVAPNNGALIIANTGTSAFQSIALGETGTYIRATNSGSINAPFTTNDKSVIFGASAGSDFIPFASLSNVFSGTGAVTYGGHSLDTGIVRADVRHTYTGNTTLAFGTTYVDSSLELPATGGPLGNKSLTAANTLLMTGGTLSYLGGNVDYSGRFSTAGSQQWKIDAAGKTVTFATALVGASSLALSDTSTGGSLTLSSASSTFSGGVTITSGTLYAGAAQNGTSGPLGITGTITFAPAGTGVLAYTAASAAFDYSSRFATTNGQGRRINVNGENVTFSTVLGGTNAFALVGSAGTLTLAAANTYTQGTTLSVGTLKCSNVQSLGTGGLAQANGTTLHASAADGKLTITGAHTNTGTGSRIIRIGAA